MKAKRKIHRYLPFLLMAILLFNTTCYKEEVIGVFPSGVTSLGIITLEGSLSTINESIVDIEDLEVLTFAAKSTLNNDGSFNIDAVESDNFQIVLFNLSGSDEVAYIGLYDPIKKTTVANDTTTALALTMLNPFMVYAQYEDVVKYFEEVKSNKKFSNLVSLIREIHSINPGQLFDYEANPNLYQIAFELMKESMENLGEMEQTQKKSTEKKAPFIENASGRNINFVNPRHVWYGAAIFPDNQDLREVKLIERVEKLVTFRWGWPPAAFSDPAVSTYNLGNGYYRIHLAMGFDLTKFFQFKDPVGLATTINTGQSVLYLMKIAIGVFPQPPLLEMHKYIKIKGEHITDFTLAWMELNVPGLVKVFCSILISNSEGIAYWIWQDVGQNAASSFIKSAGGILGNVAIVFKILGFINEEAPFFYDLIAAPREVTYFINQEKGELISLNENNPPQAGFTINPTAGIAGTVFTFDASSSEDDNDDFADLMFRWDFQSNGSWDINWSNNYIVNHSYQETGTYAVTLEVRDNGGLIGSKTHFLNVGGGAGTADHVKLFRDNLPWESNAMITMLESLGFTEGTGSFQYQVIPSSQMATAELVPGKDLVIISNDQAQDFYNNYAASQIRFNNFVYQGGSIFWEACDMGWARGSMSNAGVILPGNISTNFHYTNWNYIVNPLLPLVSGLPLEMDHHFASHESFSNLPDGAIVYCIDDKNEPTLIEFNLGKGWVLISGQPLEHQYDRIFGDPDMEELLPRIVSYFTGQDFKKKLTPRPVKTIDKPSYIGIQ